jgi:hypothetical protein
VGEDRDRPGHNQACGALGRGFCVHAAGFSVSSRVIVAANSTHSEQIYFSRSNPKNNFLTSRCDLPQNEQIGFALSFAGLMRLSVITQNRAGLLFSAFAVRSSRGGTRRQSW